jgi:acyl-CoA synthetase (AMP-forming)/AMP-acid ligase II
MVLGGTLSAGACLVCQDAFEPGGALELMERERVTTVHSFPHPEARMVDHPDARRRDLSSLRRLSPVSQLRKLVDIPDMSWGPQAAFGLSETFTIATSIPSDSPLELRRTTHGVALPGMEIRIVDPITGAPRLPGQEGEIAVRGVTMMRGYYKVSPEECFDDEGWFRTQDAGYLDEQGYLHWAGRLSGVIKTAGANVAPAEVEAALQAWGRLKIVAVVGLPHPTLGEAVVLCAVPDGEVTGDEVTAHLRTVLAPYKVPRRILFFDDDEITYTGSEKVRVRDLRRLAARRVAAGTDEWAAFLRDRHADLLAPADGDGAEPDDRR